MKAVRYLVLAVVGLVILAIAAVAIAIAVIDPNDYKPQIEKAAEDATNLDLILEGDIGWSFIPLGLELNNVEANLDGERFVALEQLIAQVDFWSLISLSPQVNTFVLSGLDAHLVMDKDGNGNWSRIMPEGGSAAADAPAPTEAEPAEPAADSGNGEPLNFNVESVEITNARVRYDDLGTGQSITLEKVTANAREITLGKSFPLQLAFAVTTSQPQLTVEGSIRAELAANEALNRFDVSNLDGKFALSGEPFADKTVQTRFSGSASADLENETAAVNEFSASLANLTVTTNLNVTGFGESPQLAGNLELAEFSLQELLEALGQAAIETTDPDVLQAIAFSTNLNGPAGQVTLDNLTLKLDDTNFTGNASYALSSGAIGLKLQGDTLNVDRYLPPPSEEDADAGSEAAPAASETAQTSPASGPAAEPELLPLDTLRSLGLDIDLSLGQLIASNLTITELKAIVTASNGLLQARELSANLYDGRINANATLDARSDNPQWKVTERVANVQMHPLLMDLAELDLLSGGANIETNLTTSGNRISALRNNAQGEINVSLAEGEFTRMNLTRMACQGIALANQESLGTSGWGTTTPFNELYATLKIDGNTLTNSDLVAALAGMQLEGDGTVNLSASTLDYEAGLRIIGEIHRDEACRVTEYVKNAIIPVECRGSFSDDPAGLCSFDGSRFRDTLKVMAENAARAKAQEEIDRAQQRAEDKVSEELERHLDSESAEQVKDALRGLFK